jgi:uncharacterized membrane protein
MDPLWSLLMLIGSAFCHQLPERSYMIGDLQMPLCARCIGIHVGFLLSSILVWTGARRFSSAMPGKKTLAVLGAMAITGFLAALLSYAGIGGSDNLSRTISGLLIGTSIPFVAVPLLNHILFPGRNGHVMFANYKDWALLLSAFAIGAVLILLSESSIAIFYLTSVLGIIGMIVLSFTILLLLLAVLTDGKVMSLRKKLVITAISCFVFLFVLAAFHDLLLPQI